MCCEMNLSFIEMEGTNFLTAPFIDSIIICHISSSNSSFNFYSQSISETRSPAKARFGRSTPTQYGKPPFK